MNTNDDFAKQLPSDATLNHEPEAQHVLMGSIETQVCKPESLKTSLESDSPSLRIGNYKILQLIGEGGMGAVWLADQTEPVKRRVALKLIKAGTDSKPIIARFEAERQALALMDHPSIAKILDGGTTESGQPYFVMELVAGIPITQYCDKHRLSLPERLDLFMQVCNAIQHAHQKGIIHRDLKPANILVGVYDGKPVPKVIDFGLAKALDRQSKLTDKTLFTEFGAVVGTLQYMSPEQADLDAIDIE
jgi:serine/threonine protein kinase